MYFPSPSDIERSALMEKLYERIDKEREERLKAEEDEKKRWTISIIISIISTLAAVLAAIFGLLSAIN